MRRALAVLVFLVAIAVQAATTVPLEQYVAALERMHTNLVGEQFDAAHAEARALLDAEVVGPRGKFTADTSLLAAVTETKVRDVQVEARIAATVLELRRVAPTTPQAADEKLLEKLSKEQDVAELESGGDVYAPDLSDNPLLRRFTKAVGTFLDWVGDIVMKIIEWVYGLWPSFETEEGGATSGMRVMVGILVGAIALLIVALAFEVIRRARKKPTVVVDSAPVASRRDEDPLSRGANEWEKYAMQLAAAGRVREAIRAWYHAVLVTLYGAGILHFRKGKTNWEYIATLAPTLPWRPEFIGLTRLFEYEWYGAHQSSGDALTDCSRRARTILDAVRRSGGDA